MSFIIGNVEIGLDKPMFAILGPCVIEDLATCLKIANELVGIQIRTGIGIIFKGSFDKANRTSVNSFRGKGMYEGLNILKEVREQTGLPVTTDIHLPDQAKVAARFVDAIQIPAFLCRQTDLLQAASFTGLPINVKKGQFQAPWDMEAVVHKIISTTTCALQKANKVILTERGTCFGYNNLINDMTGIEIMQRLGHPVIFDATHSTQRPGICYGCYYKEAMILAKAGIAAGANGLFMEVHPEPDKSPCDGANIMPLDKVEEVLVTCKKIWEIVR